MDAGILWLVKLGTQQGMFSMNQARQVRDGVGAEADLMDYAQMLIDEGHVEDLALLERVAGLALSKGRGGPPIDDPFEDDEEEGEPVVTAGGEDTKASAVSFAQDMTPLAEHPFIGKFPFDQIELMDDRSLAAGLRDLLRACAEAGVSDLHLSAGARPFARRQRTLASFSDHALSAEEAMRLNIALLAPHQLALFKEQKDYDYALALDASNRYRVNLMLHKNGAAGSYRMITNEVPRLDDLGLRNVETIRQMLSYHNGLILVTGPVGAGKTTTLAALVAELNTTREDHIITVEDPIEIVQMAKGCNITQREVGPHTRSFASALKGALREDPDIIVIGELRDLETIEMAISASETGHLVIGTMHTSDASTTLNRVLDVFPPAQQTQIRASVAECLRGIVCQRLLPAVDGGLVLACEILVSNRAIAALVREGKMQGLRNVLETGQREGMCIMENSVAELFRQRKISRDTAKQNTPVSMHAKL